MTFFVINVTFILESLLRLKGDPFLTARSLLRCAQSVLAQLASHLHQNFDAALLSVAMQRGNALAQDDTGRDAFSKQLNGRTQFARNGREFCVLCPI